MRIENHISNMRAIIVKEMGKSLSMITISQMWGENEKAKEYDDIQKYLKEQLEKGDNIDKLAEEASAYKRNRIQHHNEHDKKINRKFSEEVKQKKTEEKKDKEADILKKRLDMADLIHNGLIKCGIAEIDFQFLTIGQIDRKLSKGNIDCYYLMRVIFSAANRVVRWYNAPMDRRDDSKEIGHASNLLSVSKVLEFLRENPPFIYDRWDTEWFSRKRERKTKIESVVTS